MNLAAARFCRLADMVMDSSTGKESDTYIRKHYYDCRQGVYLLRILRAGH